MNTLPPLLIVMALATGVIAAPDSSLKPAPDPAPALVDKTLVAWVYPANLTQQGGSVLTLIDPAEHFDAIVFGEVARGKWMAGSDFFRRTHQDQSSWPVESAGPNTLVQLAIAYHGSQVTLFRNGKVYAAYSLGQAQAFGDNARVLLGLRYCGGMGEIGFFTGALEEVRLYDRALNAQQVGALLPNQPSDPKPLAWWTFEDGRSDDVMKQFPASRLEGNGHVADGKLMLDGSSYLQAAKDAKFLATDAEEEQPFDAGVQSLFYKARSQRTGNMWDTWLYLHAGDYYLYYLANARGQWDNISMARSPDGVHWKEIGRVLAKGRGVTWMGTGSTWKSPHFENDGKFFLNFSEWKGPRQTIFFAESKDLVHWTRLGHEYEFAQDERWYERNGRWDCIWTLARPGGGLYGYWTATPKAETGGRFGFGESLDGITWKALPPPQAPGVGEGEVGAIEKIGDKYYLMFGTGGLMVTLVADRPEGPFTTARKNFHLLAGHTYFARFFPTPDGVLVNHHSIARDGQVYFGALKATRLDEEGTLRLGWWKGNEKLKAEATAVKLRPPRAGENPAMAMIEPELDPRDGLVLEGLLKLPPSREASPVGLFLAQRDGSGTAILVRAGGLTEFGPMRADGAGFQAEHRADREWGFGATTRFRLLLKGTLLEFYLDDLLMQCFSLPQMATGRIGLVNFGPGEGEHVRVYRLPAAVQVAAAPSKGSVQPAETAGPIDRATLDAWSAPYRGWHYHPEAIIPSDLKIPGHEKFHSFDVPTVYQIPDQPGKWFMSFIGFNGQGYNSFVVESTNLVRWTHPRLAMGFGPPNEFDHGGCVIGAFLYESYDLQARRLLKQRDGKYWTLYGCYPRQGGYELRPGYEGVAVSDDGLTWRRAKNTPILAVQDVDCGAWEKDCIYQPWLIEQEGRFYNFYNAANGGTEQMGGATSTNLLDWKRYPTNPIVRVRPGGYDSQFCSDGKVFRDGDHWVMFYFGVGRGGAHIMAAFSRDLQQWTSHPEPLYQAGGHPGGLDAQYAHKISLVHNPANDTFYLYYCAVGKEGTVGNRGRCIGLLTSRKLTVDPESR